MYIKYIHTALYSEEIEDACEISARKYSSSPLILRRLRCPVMTGDAVDFIIFQAFQNKLNKQKQLVIILQE